MHTTRFTHLTMVFVSLTLVMVLPACSGDQSEAVDIAVAATVAALQTETAEAPVTLLPTEISTPTPTTGELLYSEADLAAFEAAFESGDVDQVRALFTDDGVLTTIQTVHTDYVDNAIYAPRNRVGGAEFRRLALLHKDSDFIVLGTPIQVGDNTVAFAWTWSYGVSGTALLHLRDGKIAIAILNPTQSQIPYREFVQPTSTPAS